MNQLELCHAANQLSIHFTKVKTICNNYISTTIFNIIENNFDEFSSSFLELPFDHPRFKHEIISRFFKFEPSCTEVLEKNDMVLKVLQNCFIEIEMHQNLIEGIVHKTNE